MCGTIKKDKHTRDIQIILVLQTRTRSDENYFPTLFNFQTSFEFTESTLSFKDNTADKVFIIINYYSVLSHHSKHHIQNEVKSLFFSLVFYLPLKKKIQQVFLILLIMMNTISNCTHKKVFFSRFLKKFDLFFYTFFVFVLIQSLRVITLIIEAFIN